MLTSAQIAMINKKAAATPDSLKRDSLSNYLEGYYFVTLNTRGESPVLSSVEGTIGATGADGPHCRYTKLGERVKEVIRSIPDFHPHVKVIDAEVMPEHLHILLQLLPENKEHLGRIIGGFMIGCSHTYWDMLGIDWRNMRKEANTRAAALKWQDRNHTRSFRGPALFVHGYNDVEAITEEQVQIKIAYIRSQAERRLIKGRMHRCFCIERGKHSRNWSTEVAMRAVAADPFFASNTDKCLAAQRNVTARLATDERGACLDYLGFPPLMADERKLPLICHRKDAAQFEQQKEAVMNAARNGWIIVSAFISPKEKEIKTQLMVELLPFIEIMDNGFADRYKPTGKAFYACAENRLLQISCWRYEYRKDAMVSREMCLVMNELARVITQRNDDWWKTRPIGNK